MDVNWYAYPCRGELLQQRLLYCASRQAGMWHHPFLRGNLDHVQECKAVAKENMKNRPAVSPADTI